MVYNNIVLIGVLFHHLLYKKWKTVHGLKSRQVNNSLMHLLIQLVEEISFIFWDSISLDNIISYLFTESWVLTTVFKFYLCAYLFQIALWKWGKRHAENEKYNRRKKQISKEINKTMKQKVPQDGRNDPLF